MCNVSKRNSAREERRERDVWIEKTGYIECVREFEQEVGKVYMRKEFV